MPAVATAEKTRHVPKKGSVESEYEVHQIPVELCHPFFFNPGRRHEDTGLADSIRELGRVLSPILTRPQRGGYEIVAGHRRWAGASAAGLETIPAFVLELNDHEAMRLCGTENLQRTDLDPLEESDWLRTYAALDGEDVATTAATFGLSTSYVLERIRLSEHLQPGWRKAFAGEGKFRGSAIQEWRFGHLTLVARLDRGSQESLLEEAEAWSEIPTAKELRRRIGRHTRVLSSAPWKWDDGSLVTGKPCKGCPSRSDAQGNLELWSGMELADKKPRCLDGYCFQKKEEAWKDRQIAALREQHGDTVKAYTPYSLPGSDTYKGLEVISGWRYEKCKEKDRGAFPVFVVGGNDDGKELWMRDTRAPAQAAAPKTLEDKRRELDGRRAVLAAKKVEEAVSPPPAPPPRNARGKVLEPEPEPEPPPKLVDDFDAVRLVLVFGTARSAQNATDWDIPHEPLSARLLEPANQWDLRGTTCWDLFDSLGDMDADRLLKLLWEYQVRPVLTRRLACDNTDPKARLRAKREAERLCQLVGIEFEPFWAKVCEEKPEPKSWAKEREAAAEERNAARRAKIRAKKLNTKEGKR